MANLGNSYNVYANLAQSSYNNRRNNAGVTYNFVNGMTKKKRELWKKVNLFVSTSQMQKMLMEMI
ncbi:hypothetical protein SNF32_15235 [Enterococcus mundtii]|nr:hypothetical protein [Enterococcus mundtii]